MSQISENPKTKYIKDDNNKNYSTFLSKYWEKRVYNYLKTLIPKSSKKIVIKKFGIQEFTNKLKNKNKKDFKEIEYLIILDPFNDIYDIVDFLIIIKKKFPNNCKILFYNFNYLWTPIFKISNFIKIIRIRKKTKYFTDQNIESFLKSSGWEKIKNVNNFIFPFRIPFLSYIVENVFIKLPFLNKLSFCSMYSAQKSNISHPDKKVTILVPCKNEEGNISPLVKRIPNFAKSIQLIFINDKSTDKTKEKVNNEILLNSRKNLIIEMVTSKGNGKGAAVREGMKIAKGEICMVLDADMTVLPEDLPQFYNAIINGYGNFINGTRLVYSLEDQSMRLFNILGNLLFARLFTFILDQKITDTLCGTKVFWKKDWLKFEEMRNKLGDIDVWGEYNLLFGASYYSIKIIDLPIRYYERLEGITKMKKRLMNAMYMLLVCYKALLKIKFVKS